MPSPAMRLRMDKERWSRFARYAFRKPIFHRSHRIWIDLLNFFSIEGIGDFPDGWMYFKNSEIGIQIGANRGEYTFLAARAVGKDGMCIALEPNPLAYIDLVHLAALNRFPNVICLPLACGAQFYEAHFSADLAAVSTYGDGIYSMKGMDKSLPTDQIATFRARVVPLDALVEGLGLPRVDFIIMDVEGAELDILRGAQKLLVTSAPRLYIELHGTASEVESFLKELGYETKGFIGDRNGRAHIWAEPASESVHADVSTSFRKDLT